MYVIRSGIDPRCHAIATQYPQNHFYRPSQLAGVGGVLLMCIRPLTGAANSARKVDLYSKSRFRNHRFVGSFPSVSLPKTEQISDNPNSPPCSRHNIAVPEKGYGYRRRKIVLTMIIHRLSCYEYEFGLAPV